MVRTGRSKVQPVPGELFTVKVERTWIFGQTRYVKGLVTGSRLDVPGLDLEIANLTLGEDFGGLLPWGILDNRPYLRCLHGYGLYLWRRGDLVAGGRSWEEAQADEVDA